MTRINTNVSSLTAQKTLARSNDQLQQALTRLSTGLRINYGKDDPAGLIASEVLRSDIVSTQRAITNSQRANQMIAIADSALGQATSLLNDIRGLVTEAANKGALSDAQIAANQLQVDSSLEALNRIAQTTNFQGKRLLDGSLDFLYTAAAGALDEVTDLQINQANLGSGSVAVTVDITKAATQGKVDVTIPDAVVAAKASTVLTFADTKGTMTITAQADGSAYNGISVQFVETDQLADEKILVSYADDALTVYVSDASVLTTMANIAAAITAAGGGTVFNAVYAANGGATEYVAATEDAPTLTGTLADGADATSGLTKAATFELTGAKGTEVFTFEAGTTGTQIAAAISLVSDAVGATASFASNTLTLLSAGYGSNAAVAVSVISQAAGGNFVSTRATGTDIEASVNGVTAIGVGNTLAVKTSSLDMTATVSNGDETDFTFTITGGGAQFQLGPDVVTNQQARIGIQSMNTARLGGVSGRLFQVASGADYALATDATTAANIVDEVITKVTGLRGRLGAFQKTTLETNIGSLNDTLENLTAAESSIRDADFAAESASLTRAQILVQSGVSVLSIANSNPQNVLALLRG